MTISRVPLWVIPNEPSVCDLDCVYNQVRWNNRKVCSSPRINKGNSDASCYKMHNKQLLAFCGPERSPLE